MIILSPETATNTGVSESVFPEEQRCAVEVTVSLIGGKWKPIILFHIYTGSLVRFSEIKRKLPQVSDRMLTKQLKELESDGLIIRDVRSSFPLRVEYSLTDDGRSLVPILQAMSEWGDRRQNRPD
jgi:DNA-binding HxlR family transcriptional regulator